MKMKDKPHFPRSKAQNKKEHNTANSQNKCPGIYSFLPNGYIHIAHLVLITFLFSEQILHYFLKFKPYISTFIPHTTANTISTKCYKEIGKNMKLGIDDEVTCFISQYFSINADIA